MNVTFGRSPLLPSWSPQPRHKSQVKQPGGVCCCCCVPDRLEHPSGTPPWCPDAYPDTVPQNLVAFSQVVFLFAAACFNFVVQMGNLLAEKELKLRQVRGHDRPVTSHQSQVTSHKPHATALSQAPGMHLIDASPGLQTSFLPCAPAPL